MHSSHSYLYLWCEGANPTYATLSLYNTFYFNYFTRGFQSGKYSFICSLYALFVSLYYYSLLLFHHKTILLQWKLCIALAIAMRTQWGYEIAFGV